MRPAPYTVDKPAAVTREQRDAGMILEMVRDIGIPGIVDIEKPQHGHQDSGVDQCGGQGPTADPPTRDEQGGRHAQRRGEIQILPR